MHMSSLSPSFSRGGDGGGWFRWLRVTMESSSPCSAKWSRKGQGGRSWGGWAIYRQDEWQHNTDGGDEEARRTRWATPICLGLSQADHCGLLVFACNSWQHGEATHLACGSKVFAVLAETRRLIEKFHSVGFLKRKQTNKIFPLLAAKAEQAAHWSS